MVGIRLGNKSFNNSFGKKAGKKPLGAKMNSKSRTFSGLNSNNKSGTALGGKAVVKTLSGSLNG